jgi:4Fe-4S ferredoxin
MKDESSSDTEDASRAQARAGCGSTGRVLPVIDGNRCEGKTECVKACPYQVFEMAVLDPGQRRRLSVLGRMKGFFHGYRQAIAVRAEECHGCGLCVSVCPEGAIELRAAAPLP